MHLSGLMLYRHCHYKAKLNVQKPTIILVEQLSVSQDQEIPEKLLEHFKVRTCRSTTEIDGLVTRLSPAAIFFDFDYPDRGQLASFARIKTQFKSIPIVMFTLQHSEALAVWAFRQGALDYLVKPFDSFEINSCIERVIGIAQLQTSQRNRDASVANVPIPGDVPRPVQGKKSKLSAAVYFVQQHYNEKIYSDAIARLCGMSPTHFSRAFKQTFDVTFQDFILRYRVREACKMLRDPNANISEVAYNVGFSDPSYFTRVFKRYVGASPSDFASGIVDLPKSEADFGEEQGMFTSGSQIVRQLTDNFSA